LPVRCLFGVWLRCQHDPAVHGAMTGATVD
jgi:hypothetical protein